DQQFHLEPLLDLSGLALAADSLPAYPVLPGERAWDGVPAVVCASAVQPDGCRWRGRALQLGTGGQRHVERGAEPAWDEHRTVFRRVDRHAVEFLCQPVLDLQ